MRLNVNKNKECIQAVFFEIRGFYEISLFEISRVDCRYA